MQSVISALLSALFMLLTPEVIKKFVDSGLDIIEDYVEKTPNKLDDMVVLTICKKIRQALSIEEEQLVDQAPHL